MKNVTKIILKGQSYAAPKTESVVVRNQGVLCGSANVSLNVKSGFLS